MPTSEIQYGQPAYTDADLQVAVEALTQPRMHVNTSIGRRRGDAQAVLDAVAPAIAARALREFADSHVHHQSPARMQEDLRARADEIEAGR